MSEKYTIIPPQIIFENRRTYFVNIEQMSQKLNRDSQHLINFLLSELNTQGSVDAEKRLIIKGRFNQQQIQSLLKKYIIEYVDCRQCHSKQTILHKRNRILFLDCENCTASCSVKK